MRLTSFLPMDESKLTAMALKDDTPLLDHTGKRIGNVEAVSFVEGGMYVTVEITDVDAQQLVNPIFPPHAPGLGE